MGCQALPLEGRSSGMDHHWITDTVGVALLSFCLKANTVWLVGNPGEWKRMRCGALTLWPRTGRQTSPNQCPGPDSPYVQDAHWNQYRGGRTTNSIRVFVRLSALLPRFPLAWGIGKTAATNAHDRVGTIISRRMRPESAVEVRRSQAVLNGFSGDL
jgi:hypothetical protein